MHARPPLVSVIVPAHNAERWIQETISSVCDQTWRELEIIIVDDGSSDRTPEIVEGAPDERLRLIRQKHLGAAAARNAGTRASSGEFVQYLDADDLLSSDKIELQLSALSSAPELSIASCPWTHFDTNVDLARSALENVWTEPDPVEWLIRSYCGEGMMQPAGWLTPRRLIAAAGEWNERLSLHDDGEYFLRVLLNATRNVFVGGPIVYYRTVTGSLSRKKSRSAIESAFAVCQSKDEHLLAARDDVKTRKAIASQYAQFAYEFDRDAPDLSAMALKRMDDLAIPPALLSGGLAFNTLVRSLGFRRALGVRSVIRNVVA